MRNPSSVLSLGHALPESRPGLRNQASSKSETDLKQNNNWDLQTTQGTQQHHQDPAIRAYTLPSRNCHHQQQSQRHTTRRLCFSFRCTRSSSHVRGEQHEQQTYTRSPPQNPSCFQLRRRRLLNAFRPRMGVPDLAKLWSEQDCWCSWTMCWYRRERTDVVQK